MIIDVKKVYVQMYDAIYEKTKKDAKPKELSQTEFASQSGISRYAVWKATEPAYRDTITVTADRFYEIHSNIPKYLPLPEDFFYYTKPILKINKYMYKYKREVLRKELPKSFFNAYDYFIYNYKEGIDKLFPKLFLPYYIDHNGNECLYTGKDYIPFDTKKYKNTIELSSPVTWEDYRQQEGADRKRFERYASYNIRANLFIRNISKEAFTDILSKSVRGLTNGEVSFVSDGDVLERVFDPYIVIYQKEGLGISNKNS